MGNTEGTPAWTNFDDFYRAEYESQIRRAFLILGNGADAADAVSDAFASVLERWDDIFEAGPYLIRCVVNSCRDLSRRRNRPNTEWPLMPVAESASIDAEIEMADLLASLPFRQSAAIVLRYYGGLTESEIAEALGCRPGSVGPTIHRALKKLREVLP